MSQNKIEELILLAFSAAKRSCVIALHTAAAACGEETA
jgi:hypothetical protein